MTLLKFSLCTGQIFDEDLSSEHRQGIRKFDVVSWFLVEPSRMCNIRYNELGLCLDIYLMSVGKLGRICLDILKDKWSPALQIRTVLLRSVLDATVGACVVLCSAFLDSTLKLVLCLNSIQALLSAPNPDDPLAENIAKHWKTNEAEAVATGLIALYSF